MNLGEHNLCKPFLSIWQDRSWWSPDGVKRLPRGTDRLKWKSGEYFWTSLSHFLRKDAQIKTIFGNVIEVSIIILLWKHN